MEQWLVYIVDGWIILIGALVSLYSMVPLIIELKVKHQERRISFSGIRVTKHLLLLVIGLALIIARAIYLTDRIS